jgi:ubiquinone/menaquinone biosynthesis C-methylase UbiE
MKKALKDLYVCPFSKGRLRLEETASIGDEISSGILAASENTYEIRDGIPDFTRKEKLTKLEVDTQQEYDQVANQIYDAALDWLFESFYEKEENVRESMLEPLGVSSSSRVLEVGCGTGRDSFRIARRLGKDGVLFLQDLSAKMVAKTKELFEKEFRKKYSLGAEVNFFISNATNLPFPDRYFDAVFHFGGFNNFGNQKATLEEFCRITKKGGKIVFGDESLPPWLEGTTFGEIIYTNNSLFRHKVPLSTLPVSARNVICRWVLGGCFYLIDFVVGEGEPPVNLDLPHKGRRGGTLRTRYFGQLEGVTLEAKQAAIEAARKKGVSLHQWLDSLVKERAKKDLEP